MQIELPKVISGTSLLGNLYKEIPYQQKRVIIKEYIEASSGTPAFDSAGKYGAGLALEVLGRCLKDVGIQPGQVLISNKLAWVRKPLTTPDPTFERGIWHNLTHDAEQQISYDGILQCFEEGNELLNGYTSQLVSVHDPDEYLAAAEDEEDEKRRWDDILEAYRALHDLKRKGIVEWLGVGAKNWRAIEKISRHIDLDWVMIANSLTIYNHPKELLAMIQELSEKNITIINSAVFHGGFLTGSDYFNYIQLSRDNPEHDTYYRWRDRFYELCKKYNISPAAAAIIFGLHIPGIKSIALNSSNPERVRQNIEMANTNIPQSFWNNMKEEGLIAPNYPHL